MFKRALKYLRYYWFRHGLLILALVLLVALPIGVQLIMKWSQEEFLKRAEGSSVLIGARGQEADLVLNSLYFIPKEIQSLPYAALDEIDAYQRGYGIPIATGFSSNSFPIVGTNIDYFKYREIGLAQGHYFSFIGDCVVGSRVAGELGLQVGDTLSSSPANYFDFAGTYPLNMIVTGILENKNTPDDRALFVDIKTHWVLMGIGHGHEDLDEVSDPTVFISEDENIANAKLRMNAQVSEANREEFHFHGDMGGFPMTSVLFVSNSLKDEIIFQGKIEEERKDLDIIVPRQMVSQLLTRIFKIGNLLKSTIYIISVVCVLLFALFIQFILQSRKGEFQTLYELGNSKTDIVKQVVFEYLMLLAIAGVILTVVLITLIYYKLDVLQLIFREI